MTEKAFIWVVCCLTLFSLGCLIATVHLELCGRPSPTWLGVVAGTAVGGILTLANPPRRQVNGQH